VSPPSALLPLSFDVAALTAEVASMADNEWVPHFNTGYFTGDWSGVALRSVGGHAGRLYPDPTATLDYADTPLLAVHSTLRAALDMFECPLLAARLLRLGPDSRIREHTDLDLGVDDGEARVHIVLTTNDAVTFWLDSEPVPMESGDAWYLNLNLKHRVENVGTADRIHLVVDCVVNDWFRRTVNSDATRFTLSPS
jgi:Aspartyl/Asparaginyl beta-hydroxylase